jgi:hypothetical protein
MSSAVETLTLQKEAVPLLRSGLAMKKTALQFSLERYRERLERFERQYDMDSATFAARFGRGELGDDADWFEWEYNLDAYRQTQEQFQILEQIEL